MTRPGWRLWISLTLTAWTTICPSYSVAAPAEAALAEAQSNSDGSTDLFSGEFSWVLDSPVLTPLSPPDDERFSVKDPTILRFEDRWHLFYTVRSKKRSHQIEYISFEQWTGADRVKRYVLNLSDGYYCAPQAFYFEPHRHWYLIYQVLDQSRKPALQPAYSRTTDIADPHSWTKPVLLFTENPDNVSMWIDFWVICDDERAHLFFTSLNGKMWRSETNLADFPHSWSEPQIVLLGDVFEASHTYSLKGSDKYLTIIEAQSRSRPGYGRRRYYKAYIANTLNGRWLPLAATAKKPFASPINVVHKDEHWTDSFSHGELIRSGYDQKLEIDPSRLRLLFQGVSDEKKRGKKYGEIPWNLGLLKPAE